MSGPDESMRRILRQLSPDLQQLTVKEVVEMKWVLKRRVMLALFSSADTLKEPLDELHQLCDARQKEMGNEKRAIANGAMTIDERKEAEMFHRTRFLRIAITGLRRVRWPPALEAFSDPLEDLMNNREVFVDAVQYLHKMAVGPSQGVDAYVRKHSMTQSPVPAQPQTQAQAQDSQQHLPNFDRSNARSSPDSRNLGYPHMNDVKGSGNDSSSSGEDDVYSAIAKTNTGRDTSVSSSVDISDLSFSKLGMSTASAAGALGTQRSQGMASSRATGRSSSYQSTSRHKRVDTGMPSGDAALRGMVQVLQQQNESLAAQLHSITMAHGQKEDVEKRVETILVDIVSAVGDVTGSFNSGGGGDGSTKEIVSSVVGNQFIADESFVTDEEHNEFQREVNREKSRDMSRNAANKAANLGVSQGRSSSGNNSGGGGGISYSNNNSKSSSKRVTSSLVWQQVHQKLQGLHTQWLASREEARKLVGRSLEEKWKQKKNNGCNGNSNGSTSAKRKGRGTDAPGVRRAMGAVPPLWSSGDNRGNSAFSTNQDKISGEGGTDTPASHQLQRDLLDFADAVTAYSKTQGGMDDGWDPAPTAKTAANMQQTTFVLKRRARDLALHLAVHGAVPNFTGFDEIQAKPHSTATDRLMEEVESLFSMHGLNKKDPVGWRNILAASEGARNELLTMHSFVRSLDKQQFRQNAAADKLAPLLEQFMKNAQKIMRSSFDPLKPFMDAQSAIIGRLQECENSSIIDKQGNRVRPLDMLSRGYLGENVSELVNALRLHRDDFGSMQDKLREMHTALHKSALTELNALDIAKRNVLTSLTETSDAGAGASAASVAVEEEEMNPSRASGRPRPRPALQPASRPIKSAGAGEVTTPRSPDAPNWSDRAFDQVHSGSKTSNSNQQKLRRPVSPVNVGQRSIQNRPPFEM